MQTIVGQSPVEGPHVLIGVAAGSLDQAASGLRSFVLNGLRNGRRSHRWSPTTPGSPTAPRSTRPRCEAEMDHAAAVGTELFVIDAGWYTGAGAGRPVRLRCGAGRVGGRSCAVSERPQAVARLRAQPRDEIRHLGRARARQPLARWARPASRNRGWRPTAAATDPITPARSASATRRRARGCWLSSRRSRAVQPDYLKWDNNFWINCDRAGHGHGATDGNFPHVSALYGMLATLRARIPTC